MDDAIVSGDQFAALADAVLVTRGKIAFWTSMREFVADEKVVVIGEAEALPPLARVVYCGVDELPHAVALLFSSDTWRVLLLHNEDKTPDRAILSALLDAHPRAVVYSQNVDLEHPRVFALPIGVANKMWGHGDPAMWMAAARDAPPSDAPERDIILLRTDFSHTHEERGVMRNVARGDITTVGRLPPAAFPDLLRRARFVLCPRGNGIDTHRFWEALVCGAIPVVFDCAWLRVVRKTLDVRAVVVPRKDGDDTETMTRTLAACALKPTGTVMPRALTVGYWAERVAREAGVRDDPTFAFVHLGRARLPDYAVVAFRQVRTWNPDATIVVLVSRCNLDDARERCLGLATVVDADAYENDTIRTFRAVTTLNGEWRDGFWRLATERLLVLDSFISRHADALPVVHLENDTMLYASARDLVPWLRGGIHASGLTFASSKTTQLFSNILIVNDASVMSTFATFLAERKSVADGGYDVDWRDNEMGQAHAFSLRHTDTVSTLPATIADAEAQRSALIFDAAAIGSFLGGPDPRNFGHALGEHAVPAYISHYAGICPAHIGRISWRKRGGRWIPTMETDGIVCGIATLHVHAKTLAVFASTVDAPPPVPTEIWREKLLPQSACASCHA